MEMSIVLPLGAKDKDYPGTVIMPSKPRICSRCGSNDAKVRTMLLYTDNRKVIFVCFCSACYVDYLEETKKGGSTIQEFKAKTAAKPKELSPWEQRVKQILEW